MPSTPPRSDRRRRRHPRAVAVAAAGLVGLIAAGGFGTPSLQPVGIGLIALGVGAILIVELVANGLRISRTVARDTLPAGERALLRLRVTGWPVRRRILGLLEWDLRPGAPAGVGVEQRRGAYFRGELVQEVALHGLPRGEHRLGPPSIALADPFGLARVRRASRTETTVLVLPKTVPVLVPFWESGAARRAGQHAGLLRGRSELSGVRDYEPGDPLSLIHWAHTARRGRLQTKELHGESGRGATLLVILDASSGQAVDPDVFETAVSAAASLVLACIERGDSVGVMHTGATPVTLPVGSVPGAIEKALATVQPDGAQPLSIALRQAINTAGAPRTILLVSAAGDRGLGPTAGHARGAGINVAAVLVGPARAYGPELRRSGAWVSEVGSGGDLGAALDGSGIGARRA